MRIRPFVWCILAIACVSVLLFANIYPLHAPAQLQVHVEQSHPLPVGIATLALRLTDQQGLPIEEADISPDARMTNMEMQAPHIQVHAIGNGNYRVSLDLDMAGPWAITIRASAHGFAALEQTLFVQAVE